MTLPSSLIDNVYRVLHRALKLAWRVFQPTTMGVKVIARDPDGRILLVKARYLEQWTLPGGGVHKRETPEDAAARELWEESGICVSVDDMRLIGLLSSFNEGKSDYVAIFAVELDVDVSPSAGSEIAEAAWFRVDDLPDATSKRTRRRVTDFLHGEVVTGIW